MLWLRPSQLSLGLLLALLKAGHCTCPETCQCDTERHLVSCRAADLSNIPLNLPDPENITQINLVGNHIREIISNVVLYKNVEYLDLSDNSLISIEDNALKGLTSLRYLHLHNNKLSTITSNTFSGLEPLVELDLSSNHLELLEDGVFADLANLTDLDLSENSIEEIKENAFSGLGSLRHLKLDDNRLITLPSFVHTLHLSHLSLSYNQLESVPSYSFSAVQELRTLDLAGNVLVQISDEAFHHGDTNTQVPRLRSLFLQNNRLTKVPAMHYMSSLVEINLSQNPIAMLEADTFKGSELGRLKTVYMSSMSELALIKTYAFNELGSLRRIYMHSNHKLSEIESDAFFACNGLTEVDLHASSLETMDENLFDWSGLEILDLRYNHWNCDCELGWLQEVLRGYHDNISHPLLDQVRCRTPPSLASRRIAAISLSSFQCGTEDKKGDPFEDGIMIAIFAGTSCLLLVLGAVLMFKYRASMCEQTQPGVDVYSYFVYHNPNRLARHHKIPPRRLQAKPRNPNRRHRHVTWSSTETDLNRASEVPEKISILSKPEHKTIPESAPNGDVHDV